MEALCCNMSRTQAALPLLQELNRGVAPSVDTISTYGEIANENMSKLGCCITQNATQPLRLLSEI